MERRTYDVLVTIKMPVIAIHQTDAQRIAADKIRTALRRLQAEIVATETK